MDKFGNQGTVIMVQSEEVSFVEWDCDNKDDVPITCAHNNADLVLLNTTVVALPGLKPRQRPQMPTSNFNAELFRQKLAALNIRTTNEIPR